MDDWTERNEAELRNPKHSGNCNWSVCKGWLNDKLCSYQPTQLEQQKIESTKCPEHENCMFTSTGSACGDLNMPPGNVEIMEGAETMYPLLLELKSAVTALTTSEQQKLYEFMHNALNRRIR